LATVIARVRRGSFEGVRVAVAQECSTTTELIWITGTVSV